MLSHHLVVVTSSIAPASTIRLVLAWRHAPAVALQHASSKAGCLDSASTTRDRRCLFHQGTLHTQTPRDHPRKKLTAVDK